MKNMNSMFQKQHIFFQEKVLDKNSSHNLSIHTVFPESTAEMEKLSGSLHTLTLYYSTGEQAVEESLTELQGQSLGNRKDWGE